MTRNPRETSPPGLRPRKVATILSMTMLCSAPPLVAQTFEEWHWRAAVTAPEGAFVGVPLTPEIFDRCERIDLADLRLADQQGVEIPHAVVRAQEKQVDREVVGRELNRDQPDPDTSRLTIDFQTTQVKNRIAVKTEGTSFRRHVRVEGSADQTSWAELLSDGWVLAAGAESGRRFETLELGENTYRYLRVWVKRMPDEPAPPRIESVTCRYRLVESPAETEMQGDLQAYSRDLEKRTSTALVDFGHRHLPIVRIEFELQRDPQRVYQRACRLWGRNTLETVERVRFESGELGEERVVETPWSWVGEGTIYRDATGRESLRLGLALPYRYVKIEIDNGNSPPLEIGGVRATLHPVHVVFEPAGATRFTLYGGNEEATAPVYEARAVLQALDAEELPQATVGALQQQASATPPPAKGSQTLVWVLMGLAVLATAALLWYTAAATKREG